MPVDFELLDLIDAICMYVAIVHSEDLSSKYLCGDTTEGHRGGLEAVSGIDNETPSS